MWAPLKLLKKTFPSELISKVYIFYKTVDFISELIDMFGFIGKFKSEVISGFDAVHQRLITLEARVEALFNHQKVVAETAVTDVKADATKATTVVEDAAKVVEDVKSAS